MKVVCKRHTELPHTSKLFSDLLYRFDRVASLYPHAPFDPQSFQKVASEIEFSPHQRAELVRVLRAQNQDCDSLRSLAEEGTVAVLTGQQVGIFGGPAYTIYKALTAAKMARQLTSEGIPAVPVFWLATEDHDLAEISYAWTFNAGNRPEHLRVSNATASNRPVGDLSMENLPLEQLRSSLADFPFGDEVFAMVSKSYVSGRTFGESFADLLRELVGSYGLLFFDPMHPESRKLAAPAMRNAVDMASDLTEKLLERNKKLGEAGYHAQVHIEKETSLFFLLDNGHRIALRRHNGVYHAKDLRISKEELRDRAESLSPNATLRPVVQDSMFPTIAYIGGPAELAYLAQSEVLYQALLGRMPVAVPRNGFTLIDERTQKLLQRYGLQLDSFFGGEDHLRELIASKLTPKEIASAIEQAAAATKAQLSGLRGTISGFDATLGAALEKSTAKIEYQLGKIQRKVAREVFNRDKRAAADAFSLYNGLYPHKHLQERFYSILPFLARHGSGLVEDIYQNVHPDCPDHHILYL